jgi:CRP-like cAMP-binding protein
MNGAEYASHFADAAPGDETSDRLLLPEWSIGDWRKLLASTIVQPFKASEVVIRHGVQERALYFIAAGTLEVGVTTFDGLSVSSLTRIGPLSIIGEQSFFDGHPRSANVWAVDDGVLLRWNLDDYRRFGAAEPALARDLLFAVARVLSARLRMTTIRVRR